MKRHTGPGPSLSAEPQGPRSSARSQGHRGQCQVTGAEVTGPGHGQRDRTAGALPGGGQRGGRADQGSWPCLRNTAGQDTAGLKTCLCWPLTRRLSVCEGAEWIGRVGGRAVGCRAPQPPGAVVTPGSSSSGPCTPKPTAFLVRLASPSRGWGRFFLHSGSWLCTVRFR